MSNKTVDATAYVFSAGRDSAEVARIARLLRETGYEGGVGFMPEPVEAPEVERPRLDRPASLR